MVVQEAAGFGVALGSFRNVCSHIPDRTRCPECRQPGVYAAAVTLTEVGRLVQARHPAEWAARREEERRRARQLRAEAWERQQEWLHARSGYLFAPV